ncbi:hypothetical protein, partial [Flavobacterium piscis]
MRKNYFLKICLAFLFLMSLCLKAQTTGMIVEPATGSSAAILDPNSDGYVSATTAGFLGNDKLNSELSWRTLIPAGTEPSSDVRNGPDCGFSDFVESTSGGIDPVFHLSNGANWLFRFRMASIAPNAKSYSILVDIDNLIGPSDDCYLAGVNPGFELEIVLSTKFGVRIYDHRLPCGSNLVQSYGIDRIQKSIAASTVCSSLNYFLDFYVDWAHLTSQFGINPSTVMRYAIVDNMAADKSTICNPSSASDIGGINDDSCGNLESCFTEVVVNQPGCSPSNTSSCVFSDCPIINGSPLQVGATVVSVTTTESNGVLRVYVNESLAGTQNINSGSGTYNVTISSSLVANANVRATAQGIGEVESGTNCNNLQVAGTTCTSPPTDIIICNANKAFTGVAVPGAIIRLYNSSGDLMNPSSGTSFTGGQIVSVAFPSGLSPSTANFLWRCVGSGETTSCTAGGGPCLVDGNYYLTAQVPGQCESTPTWFCIGLSGSTSVPTISTAVSTSTLTVTGNLAGNIAENNGVSIFFYKNGNQIATTTTTNNTGNWSIAFPANTFKACDQIYVVAARNTATQRCPSQSSTMIVSGGSSTAPIITGSYCGTTSIVSGTSTETNGTSISVYNNSILVGTTTVSGGIWSANVSPAISSGSTITAKATNSVQCESESLSSASVIVGVRNNNSVLITPNPLTENNLLINGTGTPNDVIKLYIDNWPLYRDFAENFAATATVDGSGNWSITLIDNTLYAGATVAAVSSNASTCESVLQDPTPVVCVSPDTSLVVSPDNVTICSGYAATNIQIDNSEIGVIYQLYNNTLGSNTGSSIIGNGGLITLSTSVLTSSATISVIAIKSPYDGTCTQTLSETINVTVQSPPTIALETVSNTTSCSGADGSIQISGLGNSTSYDVNYLFNGVATSGTFITNGFGVLTISSLNAGSYENIYTTLFGCNSLNTITGPVIISDPGALPAPVIGMIIQPTCSVSTGSVELSGLPSGSWIINPGAISGSGTTATISGLSASTTYNFAVTEIATSCTSLASSDVVINSIPSAPTIILETVTDPNSCIAANGTIKISGLSNTTTYDVNYLFNNNPVLTSIISNGVGELVVENLSGGTITNLYIVISSCNSNIISGPIILNEPSCGNTINAVDDNTFGVQTPSTTADTTVGNVTANDELNGVLVTAANTNVTPITSGPLSIDSEGVLTLAANATSGTYTITYELCEAGATPSNCNSATATVVVAENDAPVALDDATSTNEDTPVTINVTTNDTDV